MGDQMPDDAVLHSEWLTRNRFIDPEIEAAGWKIVPCDPSRPLAAYHRCAIEEFPTDKSPSPLNGAPSRSGPHPGFPHPFGIRSPGAIRPSSLRDSKPAADCHMRLNLMALGPTWLFKQAQ